MNDSSDFYLFKILRAHILPLTNCAFNKSGDKYVALSPCSCLPLISGGGWLISV